MKNQSLTITTFLLLIGSSLLAQNVITTSKIVADSIQLTNKVKIGNSILIDAPGTTNNIYTDNTSLLIQSKAIYPFNTIINANNSGLVGIGTSTPQAKLDVWNNGLTEARIFATGPHISRLWTMNMAYSYGLGIDASGVGHIYGNINGPVEVMSFTNNNVGIGVSPPTEKLQVEGNGRFGTGSNYTRIGYNGANAILDNFGVGKLLINYYSGKDVHIGTGATLANLKVGGNVGVGTDPDLTSTYKLQVCGDIRARRIVVDASSWCDFVFDKQYKLMPLSEVEEYINKNHHLPGIPKATIVENEGADIGFLVKQQMLKIEELTLYIIDQNKKIEDMQQQVKKLKKK